MESYLDVLSQWPELPQWTCEWSTTPFLFGRDQRPATKKYSVPMNSIGEVAFLSIEVIEDRVGEPKLPLLISEESMRRMQMIIDYEQGSVMACGQYVQVRKGRQGHLMFPLLDVEAHPIVPSNRHNKV